MAKQRKTEPAPVVRRPAVVENPEVVQATTDGGLIQQFIGNLRVFFARAGELEREATDRLQRAETLRMPTTGAEDVVIQAFIKEANAHKKTIGDHWEIASVVHRFHRRLTAARDRGVAADERAASIANNIHNAYVEGERRRARIEEERLRREAEERARQERARELERLEAEALAHEASSPELSDREQRFVGYYADTGASAEEAARLAGYKDPMGQGARLIQLPKIRQAIEASRQARARRTQAAAVRSMPLEVENVEVRPDVQKAAGATDRTTWSAEITDEAAFVTAVIEGRHGIPRDCLMPNPVALNQYARSMHELIDRWPGCRAKRRTGVV